MSMGRRLTQFQTLLAQQALRSATPKPRAPPIPHSRFLHCPSPPAAASRSPLSHFLRRSSGSAGTVLPASAAAVRTAAKRWLTAGSLDLFSLQRRRSPGLLSSSSAFLRRSPWARWLPSPDQVVLTLIGANVAVYMLWQVADPSFMGRHFTVSLENFKSGRLHTVLTSAFSHTDTGHLFSNMLGLYFFGSSISSMFGPSFLLNLYVAGALVGSTFFLIEKAFRAPRKQGASGAVNAIMLLQIFLNPKGLIYLYFVLPVPAALVGAAWIGLDLLSVNKGQGSASTHLGGALVAALAWARIRKGWF
ncbi:RHOMBOID-like protein 12, mitochondrial isoform X2 [Lolium perenne]|uniref:RHOMBOID-like protein 12, mitochondrial isoform X2 n=1 Tax=Lolium perenne TaxID=4522 RepID=UPI003A9A165C